MKVLVIGAAGKLGRLIVERAALRGYEVTAFVHGEEGAQPGGVRIVHGDVRNPSRLRSALTGQDVVVDAIGGSKPYMNTDLEASSAEVVVQVMKEEGVKRLVAISAVGVGPELGQETFFYEHLLKPVFLRGSTKDKAAMEHVVEGSGLEFLIVRPPVLSDHAAKGSVRVIGEGEVAEGITRGDLAEWVVDRLGGREYWGGAVTVAN